MLKSHEIKDRDGYLKQNRISPCATDILARIDIEYYTELASRESGPLAVLVHELLSYIHAPKED